jgi:hypothetical protein
MSEKRTGLQNKSLHSTLDGYANKLNEAGFDYHVFIEKAHKRGFKVLWTKENMKLLFDEVTKAMYGKTSSQLTTVEIQEAYQVFELHMIKQSGIHYPWHSRENQMISSDNQWWENK